MTKSVNYQSILDFSGLPDVRGVLFRHEAGLTVTGVPTLDLTKGLKDVFIEPGPFVHKLGLDAERPSLEKLTMQSLHKLANGLFNNISHGLELPWEKYLSEMHEFAAPSRTELRVLEASDPIPNEWSTLTLIVDLAAPSTVHVLFGTALAVFSETTTAEPTGANVDLAIFETGKSRNGPAHGHWLVYYLRPNEGVFYTRTAGALMTPLSTEEHDARQRVENAVA